MGFPEDQRKRAMKWLKMHAQYDDAHPWEALEIICTLAGENPTLGLRNELRKAICKSYCARPWLLAECLGLLCSPFATQGRSYRFDAGFNGTAIL